MKTNGHKEKIFFKDLSYEIINAAIKVHAQLGHGFLEKVYENALAIELKNKNITFHQQAPIKVFYESKLVGEYAADILVDDKIILELKAADEVSGTHKAQLINYLRATGFRLGIIINFGKPRLEYKRVVL